MERSSLVTIQAAGTEGEEEVGAVDATEVKGRSGRMEEGGWGRSAVEMIGMTKASRGKSEVGQL